MRPTLTVLQAPASNRVFGGLLALLTVWTAVRWGAALDPPSLWFDDLWVACLAKLRSPLDAVTLPVPTPPVFVAGLWVAYRLVPDPEVSMQLLPYLAGLAVIPTLALVVARVTESRALGLAAALVISVNPTLAHYAVFVKQYTVDALTTLVLLWLVLRYHASGRPRDFAVLAAAGLIGVLCSFPSVFVSAVAVNLVFLRQLASVERDPARAGPVLRTAFAFNVALGGLYLVALAGRSDSSLTGYWATGFMPTDSLAAGWRFVSTRGLRALRGALWPAGAWVLPLIGVGLVWLVSRRARRPLGLVLAGVYAALLLASALEIYPISGGRLGRPPQLRTDLFGYPITVLLAAAGVAGLSAWLPRRPWRRAAHLAVVVVAAAWWTTVPVQPEYFQLDHADHVRLMEEVAGEDGGIVLWPAARYLGGYYSSRGIEAEVMMAPRAELHVWLRDPRALSLPGGPEAPRLAALDTFLTAGGYDRVVYLTTRARAGQQDPVYRHFARRGYREWQRWSSSVRTHVVVFLRESDGLVS